MAASQLPAPPGRSAWERGPGLSQPRVRVQGGRSSRLSFPRRRPRLRPGVATRQPSQHIVWILKICLFLSLNHFIMYFYLFCF